MMCLNRLSNIKWFCAIAIVLFQCSVAWSNSFKFHHQTTENGLSHNEVRLIKQDKDGLLWLGTQNGLCAYDGYRYKTFKFDENNEHSLISDKIYSLAPSARGGMWVGTTIGLNYVHSINGPVDRWQDTLSIYTGLNSAHINYLLEDSREQLWVNCSTGNYLYNIPKNKVEKVFDGKGVNSFYEEPDGTFWIAFTDRLVQYDRDNRKEIHSYNIKVRRLEVDQFGILWALGGRSLYQFMPNENRFAKEAISKQIAQGGILNELTFDKNGNIWLSGYGAGVRVYLRDTHELKEYRSNPILQTSISSDDVYSVYTDHSGVVWVGTQEGLDFYDWSRDRFKQWQHIPSDSTSLACNFVQAIARDKSGRLLVGTRDNGVQQAIINGDKAVFRSNIFKGENTRYLRSAYVAGIFTDSRKRTWISTMESGLFMQQNDEPIKRFIYRSNNSSSLASNRIASVIEDRRGRIWVATMSGLCLLDESDGNYKFHRFEHNPYDPKTISLNAIFKVFMDSKGRIWLAINNGGVNLLHEEKDGKIWFERFMHLAADSTSISSNEAFVVFEDSKKQLWAGTSAMGINRITEVEENGKTKFKFKAYTEADGLADNEVNSVLEDEFGYLWIATNRGLSRFNPKTETFVNYNTYDGVVKGKFRKNAAWRDNDGTMYFGGAGGINSFKPTEFPVNNFVPTIKVTSLFIDQEEVEVGKALADNIVLNERLNPNATIHLKYPQNRFRLKMAALSYASVRRNQYQWKMDDIDNSWNSYKGNEPEIVYADLPKGKYQLQIKVANNDGKWQPKPYVLNIEVSGENNWLVLILSLVGAGILVILILKFRKTTIEPIALDNISEKKKELEVPKEAQLVIDELNRLMNEEKLYLNCNLGLNELADILKQTPNQLSAILNDYIGKNFYEYINEFRVEEVKSRLVDPANDSKTILGVAWDCGFNSKSAFNRIFKTTTGMTPSEFQKKHKKS
ncbi:helix-turn-helix domain-containing protein [Prolixibacteraceae bacterium JC049]|nr:helix-turn-helix domain-containing protein [Prolixibacteraceae bacterium JC049]